MDGHTCTTHDPGVRACYIAHRCRCLPCRAANTEYAGRNNRARQQGRVRLADAAPVREHLYRLERDTVSIRTIVNATGISKSTIDAIRRGQTHRVRPHVAEALLPLTPDNITLDHLPGTSFVDASIVRRQIAALRRKGWTWAAIGDGVGMSAGNVWTTCHRTQVRAATARAVRDLADDHLDNGTPLTRVHLDAAPLVEVVERYENHRAFFGRDETLRRLYLRARVRGRVTVAAADRLCAAAGLAPESLWGEDWWEAA